MVNHIVGWVKSRIKKNKNAIIVINGPTGSGKTYAGITLGYQISQDLGTKFSVANNIDFNFTGLLKKTLQPDNKAPGTPFLFEEVGAFGGGAASREWQSKTNKFFTSFMQTTRHRNQVLIFTCPYFSFLDAQARSLVHMQIIMQGIDYHNNMAYVKPYVLQVNSRTGKIYFKLLRVRSVGKVSRLLQQTVPYPPNDMVKAYEIEKTKYTDKLNQAIMDDEKEDEPTDMRRKIDPEAVSKYKKLGYNIYETAKKMGYTVPAIRNYWNWSEKEPQINENKSLIGDFLGDLGKKNKYNSLLT